jgi:hypothetical protein
MDTTQNEQTKGAPGPRAARQHPLLLAVVVPAPGGRARAHGRLRGREARDGDAGRGDGDVVHARGREEGDRARVAAVLAAEADLEARPRRAAALDGEPDQLADARLVERLEGVAGDDPRLQVRREELLLSVVATEAQREAREVIRAKGEEFGTRGSKATGAQARARRLR